VSIDYLDADHHELGGEFPQALFRVRVTEIDNQVLTLDVPQLA
jgi:hypothetical protein